MSKLIVNHYECNAMFYDRVDSKMKVYKNWVDAGLGKVHINDVIFWMGAICIYSPDSYAELRRNSDNACATITATTKKAAKTMKSDLEGIAEGLKLKEVKTS